jgi:D-3-phosphoglycerate dehydrogenase
LILRLLKKRKIIVCGTEINIHPTPELTWALILGLARNFKEEIDNMYQGYWQTTVGVELKGKNFRFNWSWKSWISSC